MYLQPDNPRRRRTRRLVLVLWVIAVGFYLAFIALNVASSRG